MKKIELDALRDFAIEHLPAAQRQREQAKRFGTSRDVYYGSLSVATMFTQASATSSAIEMQAARLLEQVLLLAGDYSYDGIEETIIEAAHDLTKLTGTHIPWLPRPQEPATTQANPQPRQETSKEQRNIANSTQSVEEKLSLKSGQLLSTKQAATALGRKDQTLRSWASKENGPIQPVKVNGRNMWRSDDILALYSKKPTT
jgi:hypothetical protein